jgi:hypothetical protein
VCTLVIYFAFVERGVFSCMNFDLVEFVAVFKTCRSYTCTVYMVEFAGVTLHILM